MHEWVGPESTWGEDAPTGPEGAGPQRRLHQGPLVCLGPVLCNKTGRI